MPYKDEETRRLYHRGYWKRNYRGKFAERHREKIKRRKIEIRAWFSELKKSLKCIKCFEDFPGCLDFHYKDYKAGEGHVAASVMVNRGWSKARILKEIEKCDVLCANCHRKYHFKNDEE